MTEYRRQKLLELLNDFNELGLNIVEESEDNDGTKYEINFQGDQSAKVERIVDVTQDILGIEKEKLDALKVKLLNTSIHNLKIIRSRLIHLTKSSAASDVDAADLEIKFRL